MNKLGFSILLLLLFFCAPAQADDSQTRELDLQASRIIWTGRKVGGEHSGTVALKSGSVTLAQGQVVSGTFSIDMFSIRNQDIENQGYRLKLDNHLKSDDFFSVNKFPQALFTINSVKPIESTPAADDYVISGDLTVKGIKKEISFPATIKKSGEAYEAAAKFSIDRIKWDIRYNSKTFFDIQKLGDKLIYDDIEIELDLKTK